MLLISSSILSSCQVHVLFHPCSTGVLSKFSCSYSLSISLYRSGFNVSLCHLSSWFSSYSLFSSFYRRASILVVSVVPFLPSFSTSQGSLVSLIYPRNNFVFLFLFSSVSFLRSRDEISCKWRSVVTPRM